MGALNLLKPFSTAIAAVTYLAAGATTANAQSAEAPDIVVNGQTEQEIRERTRAYVRETGVAVGAVAAARWAVPICPKVLNVSDAVAQIVERKIRSTAEQVGIRVAGVQCDPNIVIAFSSDGQQLASIIADRAPRRMAEIGPQARRALEASEAPVRWWHSTAPTMLRSASIAGASAPSSGGAATFEGSTISGATGGRSVTGSLIATADIRAIGSAAIIIDVNRAEGYSLNAVAAYTAMVALAEIRLNASPTGSILGLFTATDPQPTDLSQADIDFLRALYEVPAARMGNQQRRAIVGRVAEAVRNRSEEGDQQN